MQGWIGEGGIGSAAAWGPLAFAQKKWGPALLPAPTAPSEGSASLHQAGPEGPSLQSLAHQLRRRFRSTAPSLRRSLVSLPGAPVRRPRFRLESPGLTRRSKPIDFPRPFLGPSPVAVRFAHLSVPKNFRRTASRNWKIVSSGASSRPTRLSSEEPWPCLPRRSDLWSPAAPSCRCRLSSEAGSRRPDHPFLMRVATSRSKRKICAQACG